MKFWNQLIYSKKNQKSYLGQMEEEMITLGQESTFWGGVNVLS